VLPAAGRPTRVFSPALFLGPLHPKSLHAPRHASCATQGAHASCWHRPRHATQRQERAGHRAKSNAKSAGSIAPRATSTGSTAPRATSTGRHRAKSDKHRKAPRQEHGRRGHEDKATSASRPGRARSSPTVANPSPTRRHLVANAPAPRRIAAQASTALQRHQRHLERGSVSACG